MSQARPHASPPCRSRTSPRLATMLAKWMPPGLRRRAAAPVSHARRARTARQPHAPARRRDPRVLALVEPRLREVDDRAHLRADRRRLRVGRARRRLRPAARARPTSSCARASTAAPADALLGRARGVRCWRSPTSCTTRARSAMSCGRARRAVRRAPDARADRDLRLLPRDRLRLQRRLRVQHEEWAEPFPPPARLDVLDPRRMGTGGEPGTETARPPRAGDGSCCWRSRVAGLVVFALSRLNLSRAGHALITASPGWIALSFAADGRLAGAALGLLASGAAGRPARTA